MLCRRVLMLALTAYALRTGAYLSGRRLASTPAAARSLQRRAVALPRRAVAASAASGDADASSFASLGLREPLLGVMTAEGASRDGRADRSRGS